MMTDQIAEKVTSNGVEGTVGVKRRILQVLDGTVCVYEAGDPNRSAIVLLHGAMSMSPDLSGMRCFPR